MLEIGEGSRSYGATLYQKVDFFGYFGAAFAALCTDWHDVLHSQADPGSRRYCKVWPESVQRVAPAGRKTWFLACE